MASFDQRPPQDNRSLTDLIADLVHDLSDLVRSEGRLVRAEITEAGRRVAHGAEMVVAGGIILLLAAIVLLQALVVALAHWVGPGWASVIVGVVLFVIGGLLITRGRKDLSTKALMPERSLEQTSRDTRLVKEQLK
ncbi:phage holin family protein [Falsirhodobacter deserti]|uniref:phage holin family protein n=1 Tax=Falsirhodobacter deserti TaxID=1365611 RepID=UPI000FE3AFC4|nr:phage holin family protein [Falsirhodobacter deserti]